MTILDLVRLILSYTQRRNYLHITLFVIYGKNQQINDIHAVRCVCMNNDLCRSV